MSSSAAWLDFMTESRLATSRPVNYTFLWCVIWQNYLSLISSGHLDVDTTWACAPEEMVHAGQIGDALCDYRDNLHRINSGEVVYMEMDSDSIVQLAPMLRLLMTPGNPLRCVLRADGPINEPSSPGTGLIPIRQNFTRL
eukprot:4392007-Amphidinium_carterae.1